MGRVTRDEKARSRGRILESAARLFRERGVGGTSVGDVMKDAGLTHGGFYRHFATKNALLMDALATAFDQIKTGVAGEANDRAVTPPLANFRAMYLSPEHVQNPGLGCPVAALANEIARESAEVKATFSNGVRSMVASIAANNGCDPSTCEAAALRELAMLIGAVVVARACETDLAQDVLAAALQAPTDCLNTTSPRTRDAIAKSASKNPRLRPLTKTQGHIGDPVQSCVDRDG